MLSLLSLLLNNHYFLGAAAALLGAAALWYRGYSQGQDALDAANSKAEQKLNAQVQKTEAVNQTIETEKNNTNETVNSADTIPSLIKLWDRGDQKAPSSTPPSKS